MPACMESTAPRAGPRAKEGAHGAPRPEGAACAVIGDQLRAAGWLAQDRAPRSGRRARVAPWGERNDMVDASLKEARGRGKLAPEHRCHR